MSYRVLITDEATDDVFNLVKYIQVDLCNPDAANKLYTNLNREVNNMGDFPLKFADSGIKYRGYIIHKKIYQSYLLFYIISDENQTVYVLRILKDIMNWRNILQKKISIIFQIIDDKSKWSESSLQVPKKIWRFSSAHFYREVISPINNLWYNILEVIIKG